MAVKDLVKKVPGIRGAYNKLKRRHPINYVDGGEATHQQLQLLLINQYRDSFQKGRMPYNHIQEAGFRCYSQFEEDGIILYILAAIGMETRTVVEMCCGSGHECMAANLILNHRFRGFLLDGDDASVNAATSFFSSKKDCYMTPPVIRKAWITKDNVNTLLREMGASGEVDLLSLDMDGNDYWIWDAITEINPRLCVFETHNLVPDDVSVTIPYDPNFYCWSKKGDERDFRSVSLLAMKKLSEAKGYRMIGAHRHGFNVFFLRNDLAQDLFPAVSISDVHDNFWTHEQVKKWPTIKNMGWVEV
jgi:hypothetical protein